MGCFETKEAALAVLILVVVDNGLVLTVQLMVNLKVTVLILVVVDNGLVLEGESNIIFVGNCLNPCCSGQWSSTETLDNYGGAKRCLNPCCSGQWSSTNVTEAVHACSVVLILVVVDNGLVRYY